MVNSISAVDLNAYIDYLKAENQTVQSSDLSLSLEDYLDEADASSVVEISDSTLKSAGEDTVRENADKLAAFGITSDKISALFGTDNTTSAQKESTKSESTEVTNDITSLKERNQSEKRENQEAIKKATELNTKNTSKRDALQGKMAASETKNTALKEQYEALKAEASVQQDEKAQNSATAVDEYEKNAVGKMDAEETAKTEKYQTISGEKEEISVQNDNTEGVKVDSGNFFTTVQTAINSSEDNYDNSTGYTLAGDNLFTVGVEVIHTGEGINDRAITLAEQGYNQLQTATTTDAQTNAQIMYDEGVQLANDSFTTMSMGRDNLEGANIFYNSSLKFITKGEQQNTQSNNTLTTLNTNNDELTSKIFELQSKKVSA